jgi:integrase
MATILKRTYKVETPKGVITKTCKTYTIEYKDPVTGKRKRAKGYTDKGATLQLAARLEKAIARGAEGLEDPFREHLARPIAEHVKEYVADLRAGGLDDMYVYNAENRLNRLVKECGWTSLASIEPNSFIKWRERERTDETIKRKARLGKGASATTLNQYLDTVRAFTNWCASNNRMPGVPAPRRGGRQSRCSSHMALALAGVAKVDGEKRRKRRALSDEQVGKLLGAVPAERAIVYRVGWASGARRQELMDLQWGDLRLNAIKPYIQFRAEATKARRDDRVSIDPALAADLRKLKPASAKDGDRVFASVPCMDTWRADLASVGIEYKDDLGRQADFHGGVRKTFNTRLSKDGVPLVARMRLMRVTDPKLVNDTYHDDDQMGLADVVLKEVAPIKADAKNQAGAAGA